MSRKRNRAINWDEEEKPHMAIERSGSGGDPPPPADTAPPRPVRVITLNHAEHNDSTLYRFEKGEVVQFSPGPSLLGRKVFLYTNYVLSDQSGDESESAEFVRTQYYPLEWMRAGAGGGDGAGGGGEGQVSALGAGAQLTDTDVYAELRLRRAGAFHYYFVYDTASSGTGPCGSGWVQVAPSLSAGGRAVPLDAVCCVTVLAKCLGPLPRWLPALRPAKEAGYNMIHFTPVQELGASRSSYSIANQLQVNPAFAADGRLPTFADIENLLTHIRNEWQMLSVCDVVLNHTANESPWLSEHPEATYNARDCPHLRPAALLDAALAQLTADVGAGRLAPALPPSLTRPEQLEAVRAELTRRLPHLALHECFQCDAPQLARTFQQLAAGRVPPPPATDAPSVSLKLTLDPQRRRLAATVDMELALQIYNVHRAECGDEEARVRVCTAEFRRALDHLNAAALADTEGHLRAAIDNCIAGIRYERVSAEGPKVSEVSARHPLVPRYFLWPPAADALPIAQLEELVYGVEGARVMAHNGWVMDADPLIDFADKPAGGMVYLRRELIAWGDSVKLRYGERAAACPALWGRMRDYVELTAELFDGIRLDNCHSTPLHVAEYLLDAARNVKPDLYVMGELFTNSPHLDHVFVNRLGITSLIRECMAAWDSHEQGRLVHRFGGRPVGAFPHRARAPALPHLAHALLLDLTHDNPSPIQKRSVQDVLATAGVVATACCASGSTRGLDELVPHHIHVVNEERLYCEWDESGGEGEGKVGADTGIVRARRALNQLHVELATDGYSEVFVDQMDADTLAITRHHPLTRKSVILVARNAFSPPAPGAGSERPPRDLRVEGLLDTILLEAELTCTGDKSDPSQFVRDPRYITGLQGWTCSVRQGGGVSQSQFLSAAESEGGATTLRFRRFPPGGVLAVRVSPPPPAAAALARLHAALAAPPHTDPLQLGPALQPLSLPDLNTVLYRCEAEERAAGIGGTYDVPGYGPLVYAGLQGAASLLCVVRASDDLGHPVCANLRAGPWLGEYTAHRLEQHPATRPLAAALRRALQPLHHLPRYLQPAYFTALHDLVHEAATTAALHKLANWCSDTSFGRALALTSVQMVARDPSAPLPLPPPPTNTAPAPSLSAGLPHFATGYMRCWGRDTFIAFRGLLLLTARYGDARNHILGYGACLRHGLIPNLLDGGRNARYNCRDAVWWWLHAIQQYCTEAPDGAALLTAPVPRVYPHDDSEPLAPDSAPVQPLHVVMQEALDAHFQGRVFRERNAGRAIDAHMTDAGFTVQFGVQPDTGFVFGGNEHNAGTWMDKMGSSERAGNRGRPATPRDGSAIELVALCYSTARWLQREHQAGRYPQPGVARTHPDGSATAWSWQQWADTIHGAFERHFWIPAQPSAADTRPDLVHRRAIYKDTVGATRPYADYQLRCNYAVAMAVAPDLFEPKHAWAALDQVERHLLGPLGVKTLDPADWAYRPDYDNANDSDDPSVAHGFNYHQGPEWGWPLGCYLRARLHFAQLTGNTARTQAAVLRALGPLAHEIYTNPWRGLPELTNAGGAPCPHSCPTQAWSGATALEVLRDLRLARKHTLLD